MRVDSKEPALLTAARERVRQPVSGGVAVHDYLRSFGWGQRLIASFWLTPNYRWPLSPTRIDIEGIDRIPRHEPVIFVMNHTDFYNYWPFQWQLWNSYYKRQSVTWVKPKYFDRPLLGHFFRLTNNIRVPSRADVIRQEFKQVMGRLPDKATYRAFRDWMEGSTAGEGLLEDPSLAPLFAARPGFDPHRESLADHMTAVFRRQMTEVTYLSLAALYRHDMNLLVFPQGTRCKRLLPARLGVTQIILKSRKTVIPVGCNGSDRCHRGWPPLSRGGHIIYRVGEPLRAGEQLRDLLVDEDFEPFNAEHEQRYRPQLDDLAAVLTASIDRLLDSEYRREPPAAESARTS